MAQDTITACKTLSHFAVAATPPLANFGNCHYTQIMTNTIAIWLAALILGALATDFFIYDSAGALFLIRRLLDLIRWVAFWR